MNSLGLIEVVSVAAAIDALDIMCKSANVEFVTWERKLGGRLVTVVVLGEVAAVTAAVENAVGSCIKKPCAYAVIASPHEETLRVMAVSAARLSGGQDKGDTEKWDSYVQEV